MTGFRIAPGFSLPTDAVTQAIAILARRGAGKTHTASVLVEEVVGAGLPVVVLDPTGAWWGLRSSADGKKAGLPVVILGGEHGDVPLEATAGKVIADLVVDHPGAYVIDLSGFESKAAEHRFSADFLERLYRAKATKRDAVLLVVDEADGFAPQRPGPEQTRTLGALEAIVRRGRIRGLGVVLISQRAAVLNKNVLTQVEVLIALQTTGPQDRAAIDEWIKGNGTAEERALVLGSLASLPRGNAWVWSPSWLRTLERVVIRARHTFDSSKTPEAGQRRIEPKAFAAVDLAALGERIRATAEQAKANDPAELRKRIAVLEREVTAARAERPAPERVEVPVIKPEEAKNLLSWAGAMEDLAKSMTGIAAGISKDAQQVIAVVQRAAGQSNVSGTEANRNAVFQQPAPRQRAAAPPRAPSCAIDGVPLDGGMRKVLTVLAQYPEGRTKSQVAILTGYATGGGRFSNILSALRSAGYAVGTDSLRITDAGLRNLGDWQPLPTGRDLLNYWLGKMGGGEARVLRAIVDAYPGALTKDEVAAASGYEVGGGRFSNILSYLRTLELIEGRAELRASEALFG